MSEITTNLPVAPSPESPSRQSEKLPSVESPPSGRRFRLPADLPRRLSTLLVIAALAGLGIYGHQSDWKLPKFSAFTGGASAEREDWCEEHGVPESQCVECRPELLPRGKDYGWCKEHGIANCPLCHPDVAQLKQTPTVTEADRAQADRALALTPRLENNAVCKNYRRRIQFASLEAVKKAGMDIALVERQPIAESVLANGQITYDQTRFASLSSRLPGTAWRVEKNLGDRVRSGEILALVDAAEVGRAKTELMQALAAEELERNALQRMQSVSDIVAGGKIQEAQAGLVQAGVRLLSAQQSLLNLGLPVNLDRLRGLPGEKLIVQLRFLGLPADLANRLSAEESTANLLPIKAPLDGIVAARHVAAGEAVDASRVLFQVADTDRMWLTLNVPLEEAGKLALGQSVRFRPDGNRDEASRKLIWISTSADPQTRMVAVRAELPNPKGQLRNETFGTGRIILREEQEAVVVPNEAIHSEGCCRIVFVRDKGYFGGKESPKVFHVRTVRLGAKTEKFTEIIAGVLPGEVVAAQGSGVLRAELLKNNLGEGCCAGK